MRVKAIDQIEDAKAMFDECVAKGLVPYRIGLDGKQTSEIMDEFDPDAEEVVFLPIGQGAQLTMLGTTNTFTPGTGH